MIYFVNTIYLKDGIYSDIDPESPEYKAEEERVMELMNENTKKYNEYKAELDKKYPEYFQSTGDCDSYDYESDEYLMIDEDEAHKEKTKYEGPVPTEEEWATLDSLNVFIPMNKSNLPQKNEEVFVVKNSRTPIMFSDLEKAKKFVENNECDWEEAGYYNFADIQGIQENVSYPQLRPFDKEMINHCFFDAEKREWIEHEVVEHNNWFTCKIYGKKIMQPYNYNPAKFGPYNGVIEIG